MDYVICYDLILKIDHPELSSEMDGVKLCWFVQVRYVIFLAEHVFSSGRLSIRLFRVRLVR